MYVEKIISNNKKKTYMLVVSADQSHTEFAHIIFMQRRSSFVTHGHRQLIGLDLAPRRRQRDVTI